MRTKTIQARHVTVYHEVVDGGDGTRRTAHRVNEVYADPTVVRLVVRKGEGFDRRSLDPRDPVRVKAEEDS